MSIILFSKIWLHWCNNTFDFRRKNWLLPRGKAWISLGDKVSFYWIKILNLQIVYYTKEGKPDCGWIRFLKKSKP